MNIFSETFDEALGVSSKSFFDEPEQTSFFSDVFDTAYEESIVMPYDDIVETFMSRKAIEPLDQEEESELAFGQAEPRVPSRVMPESEFQTKPRMARQDTAELGAITEVQRNVELFKQAGLYDEYLDEVAEQNDSIGFDDVIEPVSDFLSMFNYSVAGGLEEYLLTGSPIAALEQAGEEFINAIGIDQEGARRTTFADIFSGKRGETALTMEDTNPYAIAAAGFVADVVLDPTTWFGFGFGKVAVGIGKLDEAAGAVTGARRASDLITNSKAGQQYRRLFMPNSLLKGLKEGYQAEEIADTINRLGGDQGTRLVTAEDVKSGTVDFMAQQIRKDSAVSLQTVALRENILKIAADMNEGELRLVGAYLDQPKVVEGLINQLKVDDATKQVISKGVEEWKDMFNKIFEEEETVGLLDKAQFRANYSAGLEPVTELSRAIVENMFKVRFGKDAGSAMYEKATQDGIATITENGILKASYAKKYPTLESRIQDLVPTETNVALMATRRGMESIKKVNTQKFYDAIISDTRIAVPIDQSVAENLRDPTHQMLKENGMDVWKAPALSVRKQTKQTTGEENIYYAIPSAMKEQMDDMTKIIQGSEGTNVILDTFRQVQGLWKSYALLSPGYHMRNLYSNIFNNYLAGVSNPKRYAEAMLLQVGDTKNIGSRAVRSKIERILGGRRSTENYIFDLPDGTKVSGAEVKKMADERGVTQAGLIYNESDLGIGEELMTNLQLREGKPSTTEISEGLSDWGDRNARIANVAEALFDAAEYAGADYTADQAQKTAEAYDVIARAWAWRNWKTPEEWYENRIREIKAYTVPTAGLPALGSNFLYQTKIPGIDAIDYTNPNFQKAVNNSYFKEKVGDSNIAPVFFHGTPTGDIRKSGEIDTTINDSTFMGVGHYMTMDYLPYDPERGTQITEGYMGAGRQYNAAYLSQQKTSGTSLAVGGHGLDYFIDSLPELHEELRLFGHGNLIPEGGMQGTPWKPVGPTEEQIEIAKNKIESLREGLDESTSVSYDLYLRERFELGQPQRMTTPITPPRLSGAHLDEYKTQGRLQGKNLAFVDLEVRKTPRSRKRYGDENVKMGGEEYLAVKPPDDPKLREIVALDRYVTRWEKDIPDYLPSSESAEVLGFHWFAQNPYVVSMVTGNGKRWRDLRLGETLIADPESPMWAWKSTASKEAAEKEATDIINTSSHILAAAYTRDAFKQLGDAATEKELYEHYYSEFNREIDQYYKQWIRNYDYEIDSEAKALDLITDNESYATAVKGTPVTRADYEDEVFENGTAALFGTVPYSKVSFLGLGRTRDEVIGGMTAWIEEAGYEVDLFNGHELGATDFITERRLNTALQELGYGTFIPKDLSAANVNLPEIHDVVIAEALKEIGYDGLSHAGGITGQPDSTENLFHQVGIAYNPNQVKSIENVGTWNLDTPKFMEQHGEGGLHGAIRFLDDGRADILVTEAADPTTYIHELAHIIRRTMLDQGDQDIIHRWLLGEDQYKKVRTEMMDYAMESARLAPNADVDIDEMTTQLMERFVWTVDGEEKFARGFEQYLLEGATDKNTGRAMQGTYDYIKDMMDTVYDFSNGGTVGLTPDEETNYLFQNILGRGVETEPETLSTAQAILGTATSEKDSFFSKAYKLLGDNMFTRANRNYGQQMENNSRLAHFITMLTTDQGQIKGNGLLNKKKIGRGMTADEAAESVKRYLFDYGELTPFERDHLKTIIPFYTWMRKNIPLQFQAIAQHPERYSMLPKLQNNIEAMSADFENIPTPDYFQDINAIRMPFTSGEMPLNAEGMPVYFAPDLPYGDLNRLNMKDMVSSMTPFLKIWAEIYPDEGYSYFLDSNIQDYEDQAAVGRFFGEELELPFNEKTYHAIKTLLPSVGKAARLGERATEGKFSEQALREVLGLNFRSVDVDAVVRAERFKRRDVARAMKQRLIDKAKLMGLEEAIEDMQDEDFF